MKCILLGLFLTTIWREIGASTGGWGTSSIPPSSSIVGGTWSSPSDCLIIGTQIGTVTFSNVIRSTNAGSNWTEVHRISSVALTDISSLRIGSHTYAVTVAGTGQSYHSQDVGATWTPGTAISRTKLNGVVVAQTGVAFAVGVNLDTLKAVIYKSLLVSNFSSWTAVTSSAVVSASSNPLNGIATYDGQHYLTVGERMSVFNSADSGVTWSALSLSAYCTDVSTNLYSAAYKNTNFAIIAGTKGCMMRYKSGTWSRVVSTPIVSNSAFQYHGVYIASNSIAFAVDMTSKTILRTVDGGVSWFVEQQSSSQLYSVSAFDYGIAVAGMDLSGDRNGRGSVYVRSQDPSSQPSSMPSGHPSRQPSGQPSALPSGQPSSRPSLQPMGHPSAQPSHQPIGVPTSQPSLQPSSLPSSQPTCQPTSQPSNQPSIAPSAQPSNCPSSQPSFAPTSSVPTTQPTGHLLEGNWTSVFAIFDQTSYTFLDVKCMDTVQCVMVGNYFNLVENRNEGVIARTSAGGVSSGTWSIVLSIPKLIFKALTYHVGVNDPGTFMTVDQRGGLYVSTDRGRSWTNPYNATSLSQHQASFDLIVMSSVSMGDEGGIFMVGANRIYHNLDYFSLTSWSNATQGDDSLVLNDIATIDGWTGIAVGNDGKSFVCYFDVKTLKNSDGLCLPMINTVTSSHLYNVAINPQRDPQGNLQGVAMAVAVDGTLLKCTDYNSGWFRLPFKVAVWTYSDYGHILQFVTQSVAYVADAAGFIRVTKNGGTKWYNETLLAREVSSPLFCLNFYSSSVSVVGNSIGGVFVKRPIPTPAPTSQPSRQPTGQPSRQPFMRPSAQPSRQPTMQPTRQPFMRPSAQPSRQPNSHPTGQPSSRPSLQPSQQPTAQPSKCPSSQPSEMPSVQPSGQPTRRPSSQPSIQPSSLPTSQPSARPSSQPSSRPSFSPSKKPSEQPSARPSSQPSSQPTLQPSLQPSSQPSQQPTVQPTNVPSSQPSMQPSRQPISRPSSQPSRCPSSQPSSQPTQRPTGQPSRAPSTQPSAVPSRQPTAQPSRQPTTQPTYQPSRQPSVQPSSQPSRQPTMQPSRQPSSQPSGQPSGQPSRRPSSQPSMQPTTRPSAQPSRIPTCQPSGQPTDRPSSQPSSQPSWQPSAQPSIRPTSQPSVQPTDIPSCQPSSLPSAQPSRVPTSQPSRQPTRQPTGQPSRQPSGQPSRVPSVQPSTQPSSQPSALPSSQPSAQPSSQPSDQPSTQPTDIPSVQPSSQPSCQPSNQPTGQPSRQPSSQPSRQPTRQPTGQPSRQPSSQPSSQPTRRPSMQPTRTPSTQPTMQPSRQPTTQPSRQPSRQPSSQPTRQPVSRPSNQPSSQPSSQPSFQPSVQPSQQPSQQPSVGPTGQPTSQPSILPSSQPSQQPSDIPTCQPSTQPSAQPTGVPSSQPTDAPSMQPTHMPTRQPTGQPSRRPSTQPSQQPTRQPTGQPSRQPSSQPSAQPSRQPTSQPSKVPSVQPSTQPSSQPSALPSSQPSAQPSSQPSDQPSTQPTDIPSVQPSSQPSCQPSSQPTGQPTRRPSSQPSSQPSRQPTSQPSRQPSRQPTAQPSRAPSCQPSGQPSRQPSSQPTSQPVAQPTSVPTLQPSLQPSNRPSTQPSMQPTRQPTTQPTGQPSRVPSVQPSRQPTSQPSAQPTNQPSSQPSRQPTQQPSGQPSRSPSMQPSGQPSRSPSMQPSRQPVGVPTSQPIQQPSAQPSSQPSRAPSGQPSKVPSSQPTRRPTGQPSSQPSRQPFGGPSGQPSCVPTNQPTGQPQSFPSTQPSRQPTGRPSFQPQGFPTAKPTGQPSKGPSAQPSTHPSTQPSLQPSGQPSIRPTSQPSAVPSRRPSSQPSFSPSGQPVAHPTSQPSRVPSTQPSGQPSRRPSGQPSRQPSLQPSGQPSAQPFSRPSAVPSSQPRAYPTIQPSGQPSSQPSKCPSRQPSAIPSSQPSRQPSRQPFSHPTTQPTANPSSATPTSKPSAQPASRPTGQPSLSPTRATMYAYTFVVQQGIQGTTRVRFLADVQAATTAVKATIAAVVPRLLTGDIQIGAVMDVAVIGSRRASSLEDSLSSLKAESLSVVRSQAAASGVLLTYTVTFVPSSADNYDSSYGFSRISVALSDAVSNGLFNSTLQANARLYNAVSLLRAAVPSTDSLLSIGSALTPQLLHSPMPSSKPSSLPTGQPTSRPTKKPSGQPTSRPTGQPSSVPSASPTSFPTLTVATRYIQAVETLIKKHTPTQLSLKNVFYDVMARDAQVFDSCALWTAFLDDSLDYSAMVGFKRINAVQFLQQNELWKAPTIERCTDPDAANEIVTTLADRNRRGASLLGSPASTINCKADRWVVNTCNSNSNGDINSVAMCINCHDPCVDLFCVPPFNASVTSNDNANYSTGYITLAPCIAGTYDFNVCPVFDGVARVFSVELVSEEGGVYAVFFSLLTFSCALIFVTMFYERSIDSSRKKVGDSRVLATLDGGSDPQDSMNVGAIYPGHSAEEGEGNGGAVFSVDNPTASGRSTKSSMLNQLQAIFKCTYFSPRIVVGTGGIRGPPGAAVIPREEISVSERIRAGLFPFHFMLTPYHETLRTSRSLRIKYHIQAFSRVVLVLFFMTLFFNSQYTPDDGSCAQLTSESACDAPHTIFSYSVKTCRWIHSGEGEVLTAPDPDSPLFVAQCVWANYAVSMDIYFRLLLVTVLIASAARHVFYNDMIEHFLFRSAASVYYSNILLAVLQLGINRHRLLFVRRGVRSVARFSRQWWRRMFPSSSVAASNETNATSGVNEQKHSSQSKPFSFSESSEIPSELLRPVEGTSRPSTGTSPAKKARSVSAGFDVDRNTVSDEVSIQISDEGSLLLNDFKTALFTHRATAMPSEAQCREFDLQWGLHPTDGRLFGVDEEGAAVPTTCWRGYSSDRLDPEIVLAEEMLTVSAEGVAMHKQLMAWTAHRQAYVDRKKKRKHFVVEPYEQSVGQGLFLLFLLDLLGRDSLEAMSLQRVVYDTVLYQAQPPTTSFAAKAYLTALLVVDALFIFYCIQYTRQKPLSFMYVWLILALLALAVDMLVVEGAELLWCKVVAPHAIDAQVGEAIQVLVGLINEYQGKQSENKESKSVSITLRSPDRIGGDKFSKRRNADLDQVGQPSSDDRFCVSRYFAVSATVCRVFRNIPHSVVISAYRDTLPPTHLAKICHYDRDAYVRSGVAVLAEDSTARQVWIHILQSVTRGARFVLYYTSLWMSARLPTQLQRVVVSSCTVFLIFVLYCLVKLMLRNQVTGAVAVVLVGTLVVGVSWLMMRMLCPIGHVRDSRVVDEQSAMESTSERQKHAEQSMQTALEDMLGSPIRRRRGVAVSPLDGDQKESEPADGWGDEHRQEEKEEEKDYALSDSERDSASADSDDDDDSAEGDDDEEEEENDWRNSPDPRATHLTRAHQSENNQFYINGGGVDSDDDMDGVVPVVDGWAVHV